MVASWLLPAVAAGLAYTFAAFVGAQYVYRHKRHQLLWALGLVAYGGAAAIEAWASVNPWTPGLYRVYFTLASGTVGLLGAGTLALVASESRTRLATMLVGAAMLIAFFAPWALPFAGTTVVIDGVATPFEHAGAHLGSKAVPFTNPGRIAFLLLNVVGGLALIAGALWSWRATRRPGVLLIGLGATLPFLGGSFSTLAGLDARILMQALGIAVMFAGFLLAERGRA